MNFKHVKYLNQTVYLYLKGVRRGANMSTRQGSRFCLQKKGEFPWFCFLASGEGQVPRRSYTGGPSGRGWGCVCVCVVCVVCVCVWCVLASTQTVCVCVCVCGVCFGLNSDSLLVVSGLGVCVCVCVCVCVPHFFPIHLADGIILE